MDEPLELTDIQGLVARGYGGLRYACFLPLTIDDPAPARPLLARWAAAVTSAEVAPAETATNLAFTAAGVSTVAGWPGLPAGFPYPFASGMATPYRSRFLGDLDGEDPRHWRWGGPTTAAVHALLLLYDCAPDRLTRRVDAAVDEAARAGLRAPVRLPTDELTCREPFGFRDGISQPMVAGLSGAHTAAEVVRAGEFILGYRNEYGQLTERPLLPAGADPAGLLPRDAAGAADLGRNGSYLVMRQLEQDVTGFWRFLAEATRRPDGTPDDRGRQRLAAKFVGRWPSGAPLVLAPDRDEPARAQDNDFGYHAADRTGLACPIGAHVRRVNPRDSLEPAPGSTRSTDINRRHRLLRRSRSYRLPSATPGATGAGDERGIYFMCLNGNLARQYEFVQHTWANNPVFNGLYDETDPLVGARHRGGGTFTEPASPARRRHRGLPQFVTVRGGAYFFLPGLAALRYLTQTRNDRPDAARARKGDQR